MFFTVDRPKNPISLLRPLQRLPLCLSALMHAMQQLQILQQSQPKFFQQTQPELILYEVQSSEEKYGLACHSLSSYCQGTTVWITDLCLITGQFWDQLQDQLQDHLQLSSDSITSQLCNHRHDCPCDCLYDHLVDHLHFITGKLRDQLHDQLHILNSNIAEAQDPGLSLWEAMAKDRRIVHSLITQCCTTCMYILMVSLMMGP